MAEHNFSVENTLTLLLDDKKYHSLRDILSTMNPADIAAVFDELPESRLPLLFRLLHAYLLRARRTGCRYLPVDRRPQGKMPSGPAPRQTRAFQVRRTGPLPGNFYNRHLHKRASQLPSSYRLFRLIFLYSNTFGRECQLLLSSARFSNFFPVFAIDKRPEVS